MVADRTIEKTIAARGLPNESGRLVTKTKIGPRRFNAYPSTASEAEVEEAGYTLLVPKTNNAPKDSHHPEYCVHRLAMRCGYNNTANYNKSGNGDNGDLTAQVITGQIDGNPAQDLANEQCVRDTDAECRGVMLLDLYFNKKLVFFLELLQYRLLTLSSQDLH